MFVFIEVNSKPSLEEQLTSKIYVDQAIFDGVDKRSLLRLDSDDQIKLDEQDSIVPNSSLTLPKAMIKSPTKSYIDKKILTIRVKNETPLMLTSTITILITSDLIK